MGRAIHTAIRVAVFDIGDVLFLSEPQADFFARWEQRLCLTPGTLCRLLWHSPDIEDANVGLISAEEYCRRCAVRLRAARLDVDEKIVLSLIEEAFSGEQLNHELVSYIQSLRPHIQIAALTNNWSFGRSLIEWRGITELFDLIITSAEEGIRKPHPGIYQILLERLAIAPEEAVFVDDNRENIEAARHLGLYGIHFRSTGQTISELNALLFEPR